jgi:hypothetical protein
MVAALVFVGFLGWRWVNHPDALQPYYGMIESAPIPLGHTMYNDAVIGPASEPSGNGPADATVTVESLTPVVTENTSQATVVLLVCERNSSHIGIGTQEGALSASCTRVYPFKGPATLDLGFTTVQIVAVVTPHKAGVVDVAGYEVSYEQGIRHGTQHVGAGMTFTTAG